MSLDYDLTDIKDRSVHFPPNDQHVEMLGTLNQKIQAMIFGTMATGIGDIKDETEADEFYTRYRLWSDMFSSGEASFTREDVRKAVGLRTNVFPREPRDKWLGRMYDRYDQDLSYADRKAATTDA